ncbi:MAG: hypothetical protein AAGI88_14125, partial [Pseudomonadota bacterium]
GERLPPKVLTPVDHKSLKASCTTSLVLSYIHVEFCVFWLVLESSASVDANDDGCKVSSRENHSGSRPDELTQVLVLHTVAAGWVLSVLTEHERWSCSWCVLLLEEVARLGWRASSLSGMTLFGGPEKAKHTTGNAQY